MEKIIRIGMDTSKSVFELHGVDEAENPVMRRQLRREAMVTFFKKLAPTVVGLEACGASHHWARVLEGFGHEVRLVPPQYAKAYRKRNKNDAADAEAICEAMSRPSMRFVPVKTAAQQGELMLLKARSLLIKQRTQVCNAIRGHAAEFGLTAAKGLGKMEALLRRVTQDETVPALAREIFALLGEQHVQLDQRIDQINARLRAWHRANSLSKRLAEIPGVGEITAPLLVMKVPNPRVYKSGRHCGAWVGLTAKDHSTAGKTRLGGITRAGDEDLRSALVAGAMAVIQQVRRGKGKHSPWLVALVARKPAKVAAVALANKIVRIAWRMMMTGEPYRADYQSRPPMAKAA